MNLIERKRESKCMIWLKKIDALIYEIRKSGSYMILTKKELKKRLKIPTNEFRAFSPKIYQRLRENGAWIDRNWIIIPKQKD